jgi:hypothetical protein
MSRARDIEGARLMDCREPAIGAPIPVGLVEILKRGVA